MAAEIHPKPLTRKPILLSKVEGSQELVNMAVTVPKEDGVISVSEDRTVRVWMKRDSGQYWPSIYHAMPAPCSCMSFNPETRRLSVGLDNGTISEFILAEDYNKMTPVKSYLAHQGRVTMVLFVLEMEWVLSTGQDKNFTWHCSESGRRLGSYRTGAWAACLQFDIETRHVFVGDHSGQVTILKLEQENCSLVTTFKGHTALSGEGEGAPASGEAAAPGPRRQSPPTPKGPVGRRARERGGTTGETGTATSSSDSSSDGSSLVVADPPGSIPAPSLSTSPLTSTTHPVAPHPIACARSPRRMGVSFDTGTSAPSPVSHAALSEEAIDLLSSISVGQSTILNAIQGLASQMQHAYL
ncbi:WD repeat and FYVE domain-containing protein 2 isoform X2 [Pleurodeles waltl]|uniref:WD repeat and FYVE domain-containing protein 2 isoform X2 n=1 Tax=Pleurodeles waltl TaxID=8319 RepID=UPI0037095B4C